MKVLVVLHLVATLVVIVLWSLGNQVGAYDLWTNLQGPLSSVTLFWMLGWDRVRNAGWRSAGGGLLCAASWYLLLAFPFFDPPSTRLMGYWGGSPWESLVLLPILSIAVPLSSFVSSIGMRLAARSRTSPFLQILFWNAIPASLVVIAYNTDHVWIGIPVALTWHAGLVRGFLLVEKEPPNATLQRTWPSLTLGPGR
jgi:hypothetical protein